MKITEKMLMDGYFSKSNGFDNMSKVGEETIWWTYRCGPDDDGAKTATSSRERAANITLEYSRSAEIPLDMECDNHPALAKITDDYERMCGAEIA